MATIYYQIAEQYLCVVHEDIALVRNALDKYEAFLVQEQSLRPEDLLLSVIAGNTVVCPKDAREIERAKEATFESVVYRCADGSYYLSIEYRDKKVEGLASKDWHELRLRADWGDLSTAYLIDRLIMIAFTMASTPLGYLKVHASVTELNGRALVFMGVSGTGKSTHSRLWREYIDGATLLNDDEPIIRRQEDGTVRVYGCPWSGSTACYRNEWAEVVAFLHLYQAKENKLSRLSGRESFDSLFSSCAFMTSQAQNKMQVFDSVARVLEVCPVYRLDNRPELEAVQLSHSLLSSYEH